MKITEIGFRLIFIIRKIIWKRKIPFYSTFTYPNINFKGLSQFILSDITPNPNEKKRLLNEADDYLKHRWKYFNYENCIEEKINWHQIPNSNIISPKIFSFDINIHDEKLVGNCKDIWEKNRHHHLTVLSLAFSLTKKEKYAAEVKEQILDWIHENPYLIGINWTHPLESAIRLISWVWCERLLRNSAHYEPLFGNDSPVWTSIYFHQEFIASTYSRGSSANNHLIGEMAGLFVSSFAFPCYSESKKWQSLSRKILEKEIVKQTFTSGCNKEQAFSYQIFVIEFFLLAALEAQNSNHSFSTVYLEYLKKMIEVVPLMTDVGGNLPRYGDGDDALAIQLQPILCSRDKWIFQIASQFLQANVPAPENNMLASQVLGYSKKDLSTKWPSTSGSIAWKDAGIFSLVNNRGTAEEIFVLADAGPLGFLSISAHGHADALSFTLSAAGIPFLIDPGTYAYLSNNNWREYFRSTRAHNTIIIDGQQQSESLGPFLWGTRSSATVTEWKEDLGCAKLIASHDGFSKMGITHQRTFKLKGKKLSIKDEVQGNNEHLVEIMFHFHPECSVYEKEEHTLIVSNKSKKLILELPKALGIKMETGGKGAGWYSSRFGTKVPSTTVISSGKISLPAAFNIEMEVLEDN